MTHLDDHVWTHVFSYVKADKFPLISRRVCKQWARLITQGRRQINYYNTMMHIIKYDDAKLILWYMCEYGYLHNDDYFIKVSKSSNFEFVITCYNILVPNTLKGCDKIMENAIEPGNLLLLEIGRLEGLKIYVHSYARAAKYGHLHILKWLAKYTRNWEFGIDMAAYSGHINILEWYVEKGVKLTPELYSSAARNGQMKVIEWLYSLNIPFDEHSCEGAVNGNNFDILKWMYDHGAELGRMAMNYAAGNNNVMMLDWLYKHGASHSKFIVCGAIDCGGIESLKWLYDHKIYDYHSGLEVAVYSGSLDFVKFIWSHHNNGSRNACIVAAGCGYLEILQWLHAAGAEWSNEILGKAIRSNNEHVVSWIKQLNA